MRQCTHSEPNVGLRWWTMREVAQIDLNKTNILIDFVSNKHSDRADPPILEPNVRL